MVDSPPGTQHASGCDRRFADDRRPSAANPKGNSAGAATSRDLRNPCDPYGGHEAGENFGIG